MATQSLEVQLRERGLELLGPCMNLAERPELLLHSAVLRDFTPAEADLLGASMLVVRARPGQLLIAEDEASDWMMLLLHGTVDVGKRRIGATDATHETDTTRLAVLKEGAVLGEMSMLDGEP